MIAFCQILCYSIIAAQQQQALCGTMQVAKPLPRIRSGEVPCYPLRAVRMFLHQRPMWRTAIRKKKRWWKR